MKGDYEILSCLGRGGQATTWLARHTASGREVALKELRIGEVEGWKAVELFEREAEVLRGLDHPDVPEYIDAFSEEAEGRLTLWLVQEYVAGQNLLEELGTEGRWSPGKAAEDLVAVLEILVYLHDRVPPVIHRDIKPSNLLRRSDGRLCLVDFGAVQFDSGASQGSTVIGTPGYMPMEQMAGQAGPRSDLYSLGVTFGHLLTGLPPSRVRLVRTQLDFRAHLDGDSRALSVIESLSAPALEDRFISARRALEALREPPGEEGEEAPPGRTTPASVLDGLMRTSPREGTLEPLHRRTSHTVVRSVGSEDISGNPFLQVAEHLGFERLGKRSRFSFPFVVTVDVWVDPTGRAFLVDCPDDPADGRLRWFLVTLMEDGGHVLQSESVASGLEGGNWNLKASGDLLKDYARHLEHVGKLQREGREAVEGLSDVDDFLGVYEASVGELVALKDRLSFWTVTFLVGWLLLWFPVVVRAWTYLRAKRRVSRERRALPPRDAPTLPPLLDDVEEVSAEAPAHQLVQKKR